MRLLIIGTGYVGLVTGSCLAEVGHEVLCLDIDEKKIQDLQSGIIPIFEPGLEDLIKRNVAGHRLNFTIDYKKALEFAEVCFVCVPTPSLDNGEADLSLVNNACKMIANHMDCYKLIVIKSTVPPGSTDTIRQTIQKALQQKGSRYAFDVASNPEFLREGNAIFDCMRPDRVILGSDKRSPLEVLRTVYAPFGLKDAQLIEMDPRSAEMTKYASNAMLATRISFMNELAGLCEKLGANIEQVRLGIGSDKRIGNQFLCAGVGFGGSCFPKDLKALQAEAKKVSYDMPLLTAVETINHRQKKILLQKMIDHFKNKGGVKGKTIAIWGISFKPNTDDIREAPSIELIKELKNCGAKLKLFDPAAMKNAKKHFKEDPDLVWCKNEYEASDGADAIALITEWQQFRVTDFEAILNQMKGNALFDGRNQYAPQEMSDKGFNYFAIGIPKLSEKS